MKILDESTEQLEHSPFQMVLENEASTLDTCMEIPTKAEHS